MPPGLDQHPRSRSFFRPKRRKPKEKAMRRVWYNDNDPNCCVWLRELIKAERLPEGDVDGHSIHEIADQEVREYRQAHFFAGIGGWPYALRLAEWPEDREVWTGSCPCQSFSVAGKREGQKDPRHLWPAWFKLIRNCRPPTIFGEQVEGAIGHGWLDDVFADLEGEGYACGAAVLGAHSVGAPHRRQRIFWAADADRTVFSGQPSAGKQQAVEQNSGPRSRLADAGHARMRRSAGRPEETGREPRGSLAGSSNAGGLADAEYSKRRPVGESRQDDGRGRDAGRPEACCGPGACGEIRALADDMREEQVRTAAQSAGTRGARGRLARRGCKTFWSGAVWGGCKDGKLRAIEPGIFPLAHGLPRGLVPSGDPGESYANEVAEARTMRLKGYGNAIVPQVAAEFIGAFLDATGRRTMSNVE
jgi:DNA (cytosine-5)-methyltransferase 1